MQNIKHLSTLFLTVFSKHSRTICKVMTWVKLVLLCYGALYFLRFCQLNLGGHRDIAAEALPYQLLVSDEELMLYNKEELPNLTAHIRLVDLNGDLKKELIFSKWNFGFDYKEIYSVNKNGSCRLIGTFYTRSSSVIFIPPWTLWGYPVIKAHRNDTFYWDGTRKEFVLKEKSSSPQI